MSIGFVSVQLWEKLGISLISLMVLVLFGLMFVSACASIAQVDAFSANIQNSPDTVTGNSPSHNGNYAGNPATSLKILNDIIPTDS